MKVKYDVTDVEVQGDFKEPQPGLYRLKLDEVNEWSGQYGDGAEAVFIVVSKSDGTKKDVDGIGGRLWTYLYFNHEPTAFRWAEFLNAIGAPPKGTFDSSKYVGKAEVLGRIKGDKDRDTDEYRAKLGKVMPLPEDAEEPEDEPEPDEPEAEEEPEAEPEEEALDLDALDRDELKKLIKEESLGTLADLGITKSTTDDQIRDIIAEKMGGGEEEPEAEPEEEEPEPEEEPEAEAEPEDDGLDDLDRDGLKKVIKDESLGSLADLGINKATSDDAIREIIREKRGGGKPDYDSWSPEQLKSEIKERGLTLEGRYSQAKALTALKADDASDSDPF